MNKKTVLENLRALVARGENMAAISNCELEAWKLGASPRDTETAMQEGAKDFVSSLVKPRTHYVYGSGMVGCLYDNGPYITDSLDDAITGVLACFSDDLTEKQEKSATQALREHGICFLPSGLGADYCEVTECNCSHPSHLEPEE